MAVRHPITVQIYYDGGWHDAPTFRDPVSLAISRGRQDEQRSTLTPSSMTVTLDNRSGAYDPDNPMSPLYGQIGRNTPIRVICGTPIAEDFEDDVYTVPIAATGAPWARASDQAHSGAWSLKSGSIGNNDFSTAIVEVPIGTTAVSFWYRVSSETNFDWLNVYVEYADGRTVQIVHASGAVDWTMVDADVDGATQVTFQYTKDPSQAAGDDAAWIDDLEFRDQRGIWEVARWNPDQTPGWPAVGKAWTEVTGAGVLRRLGRPAKPLLSPARRAAAPRPEAGNAAPVVYWPCEDGAGAKSIASGLSGGEPMRIAGGGKIQFGSSTVFPGSNPLLVLAENSLIASVPTDVDTSSSWHWRMLISVPQAGYTDGRVLANWWPQSGTGVLRWALVWSSAGAAMRIRAVGYSGETLDQMSIGIGLLAGWSFLLEIDWQQVGSNVQVILADRCLTQDGEGLFPKTSLFYTFTGRRLGRCRQFAIGGSDQMQGTTLGHIGMSTSAAWFDLPTDPPWWILGDAGEDAASRFMRVCGENGVPAAIIGEADTLPMGPQPVGSVPDVVGDVEQTDGGLLFEPRALLGLGYRTRPSLCVQEPRLVLDYAQGHVVSPLQRVKDDQQTRNDITARRPSGSSARAAQESGPLNVNDPTEDPQGVGPYEASLTANPLNDSTLAAIAWWHLSLGTVDEPRYPQVTIDLDAAPELAATASAVNIGDRIRIANTPPHLSYDDIDLLVVGSTENIDGFRRVITLNCAPYSPYAVGVWDDPDFRWEGGTTVLDTAVDSDDTSWLVEVVPPWSHADGDFDVRIGGERCTVTGISGTTSPQTWTVVRAVNGVVKAHQAGAEISLWHRPIWSL